MSIPRCALIGVTGYGKVHFANLKRLLLAGEIELVGVSIINPQEAAEVLEWLQARSIRVFDDYQHMLQQLSGKLDLCCVPTGISLHGPMAEAVLAAGANLLVEKPLAGSPADGQAICGAAERAGKFACVGYQAVWAPSTVELVNAIHNGQLGRLRKIAVRGIWPRPASYYQRNSWAGRYRDRHGIVNDNPANNALAHFLNLALLFAGPEPWRCAQVTGAEAELFRANPIETYDTILARMQTREGVEIFFGATHASRETVHPQIDIVGDYGKATWSYDVVSGGFEELCQANMFQEVVARAAGREGRIYPASEAMAHVLAVDAISQAGTIGDCTHDAVPFHMGSDAVMTIPGIARRILAEAEAFLTT